MNSNEFKTRYKFEPRYDMIAEGTYSRVYRATDELLQRDICIKLFRKELVAGTPLIKELSRAGVLFHPNICAFYDLVEIEETNVLGENEVQPIGIIEFMNGGMLTEYVLKHRPGPDLILKFIKEILKGLSYLHSIGRPHLDIKPGNILIKSTAGDAVVKISDVINSENMCARSIPVAIDPQQLCYRAPESFDNSFGELGARADLWSLGSLVFEIVNGSKLFYSEGDSVEKTIRKVGTGEYQSDLERLPEPFRTFLRKCLIREVAGRSVSIEELVLILDGLQTGTTGIFVAPAAPVNTQIDLPRLEESGESFSKTGAVVLLPKESSKAQKPMLNGIGFAIAIGAVIVLSGTFAFISKIESDGIKKPVALASPASPPLKGLQDTTTTALRVSPRVVHDTVKVVQVLQAPLQVHYKPAPNYVPASLGSEDPAIRVKVMPMLPYFDYLFTDKPYYFDLRTPLMSDEEFDLYCSNAAITALGKNTFYVKPVKAGLLDVLVLDRETHSKVAEKVYNVRSSAVPVATIGDDITGGFVSPKLLLAKLTMRAKSENGNFRVKSFHMACKSGACDIQDASDNGAFSESMIKFLKNVKPGEEIYFDHIVAEDDKGQTVGLDPFEITTY